MISMLIGTVAGQERDGRLVVSCAGVGYSVMIGKRNAKAVEVHGKAVCVYVRQTWSETAGPALHGWLDEADRALFDRLCKVENIGPSRAAKIVDVLDTASLQVFVKSDAKKLSTYVEGLGPVGAKKIIEAWGKE